MTDAQTIETAPPPLLARAHRTLRMLSSPDTPFAGALVTSGDGVAVRCPSEELAGWAGWHFAGAQHVAGPLDIVRRADGHDVLLPWCTDRLQAFIDRRSASGQRLRQGEVCTVAVSLLRGIGELARMGSGVEGTWWLTDGGRPLFVIGEGSGIRSAAATIVETLRDCETDRALRRVLDRVGDGLRERLEHPRVPRRLLDEWECELLALVSPRPLEHQTTKPVRARDLSRVVEPAVGGVAPTRRSLATRRSAVRTPRTTRARVRSAVRMLWENIASRIADAREAVRVRRATSGRGRDRAAAPRAPRRRLLLIAAAGAAVVLVGGLMWPSGDGGSDARGASTAAGTAPTPTSTGDGRAKGGSSTTGAEHASAAPTPRVADAGDPAAAVPTLVSAAEACHSAGDAECVAAIAPGSAGTVDAVRALSGELTVELVDEYGDVAVTRVARPAEADAASPTAMVVLVRQDDKWLVRDVYDVADQPE
ncbi:hypothetical protein [Microbacterium sp. K41]|uniref:hypothetical protein n=1 Tax=Microbacterium sp. K41 TaxID=2305437 RepID=UPI00109D70C1|nr:hypothetical protein [Microbacterium sp. K41]